MEHSSARTNPPMESLTQALLGLAGIRRDLRRHAGLEQVPVGLAALGAIRRVGPARVSDVANDLQVDLSVASRQVQALQVEGLIVRTSDPSDRRSSLVSLSPAGEAQLARVHARMTAALDGALAAWAPAELQALIDGLVRLRTDLAAAPCPRDAPPSDVGPESPRSATQESRA